MEPKGNEQPDKDTRIIRCQCGNADGPFALRDDEDVYDCENCLRSGAR